MLKKILIFIFVFFLFLSHYAYSETAKGPCADETHNQFDFWLGEWEVFDPEGKKVGESRILKILGNCVLFENWTSGSSNYAGKSFNTFNPVSKKWEQVWVDTSGATIHFSGEFDGKVMAMEGEHKTEEGIVFYIMQYKMNKDMTVRQIWKQSKNKNTWETIFDGLYKKVNVVLPGTGS